MTLLLKWSLRRDSNPRGISPPGYKSGAIDRTKRLRLIIFLPFLQGQIGLWSALPIGVN